MFMGGKNQMATIKVRVQGEIATNLTTEVKLVCQNDKYDVEFEFDESWANSNFKTALFIYNGQLIAIPFDGNVCKIPALYDTQLLHIGVKSNDIEGLHTTTPARVGCLLSANDLTSNKIPEPSKDVYDEIIALMNEYIAKVDLTDYQKKVDENLRTESKEIVGAINELHDREDKQGLSQEQVEKIVDDKIDTLELVEDVQATVNEETYEFTIKLKDKEGNVVSSTNVTLPISNPDLSAYVKNTDIATQKNLGISKVSPGYGVLIGSQGVLYTEKATDSNINEKDNNYKVIVPSNLDYAVKVSITTNTETWTDEEKASACETIGAVVKYKPGVGSNIVYGANNEGEMVIGFSIIANAWTLAYREYNGALAVGAPSKPEHAIPKSYFESVIAELRAEIEALKNK
jgi:hypothetical protein